MANKKFVIQIVVVITAFAGAVWVLHNGGLFGKTEKPALQASLQNPPVMPGGASGGAVGTMPGGLATGPAQSGSESLNNQALLPLGNSLTFDKVINRKRFLYDLVDYPKLDISSDIGVSEDKLIVPAPVSSSLLGNGMANNMPVHK